MNPMETLLGKKGERPMCRDFGNDVAVHWWYSGAKKGDPCLCGKSVKGKKRKAAAK